MSAVEIIPFTTEADWLKARQQDVTSTESAALFGMSPYITRFELWHRKKHGGAPDFQTNARMDWGNRLEAAIAQGIAAEQGWEIRPMKEYFRLPDLRIGSSFDFVITNHPSGQPAHLEIKNVDYLAYRDGWLVEDDGLIQAPEQIEMQVQHQMLCSGFPRSYIGALIGGNRGVVVERERDDTVIAAIRHRIAQFWASVDAGIEPPPVMPEDADAVIRLNQHAEPGKILDASGDAEIARLVQEYKQRTAARDTADEDAKVLKAEILQRIGDAERVLLPNWTISAGITSEVPPTLITQEMVGTSYGGRKGFRGFRVNAKKVQAAA